MDLEIRAFVSFASSDDHFVCQIFHRLKQHGVETWNYARSGEEVALGEPIKERLTQEIANRQYFIPVVSPNSIKSQWVQHEVQLALELTKERAVVLLPIVHPDILTRSTTAKLPAVFHQLIQFAGVTVDFPLEPSTQSLEGHRALERAMRALCQRMQIAYQPPAVTHPRLPFMQRFNAELYETFSSHPRFNALYEQLMDGIAAFTEAFAKEAYSQALPLIQFILSVCETELPACRFYYPNILKALTCIALSRYREAEDTLQALADHPRCDECVPTALAQLAYEQRDYPSALWYFEQAENLREALKRPKDPALECNLMICRLLCGQRGNLKQIFKAIEQSQLFEGDQSRISLLKATALVLDEQVERAIQYFEALRQTGELGPAGYVEFAEGLRTQLRPNHSERILREALAQWPQHELVLHALAVAQMAQGKKDDALRDYAILLQNYPQNRLYRHEAAQLSWRLAEYEQAREHARAVLDVERYGLPSTRDDFHMCATANWILGDTHRTQYDLERAGPEYPHPEKHLNL